MVYFNNVWSSVMVVQRISKGNPGFLKKPLALRVVDHARPDLLRE
jgi:hypothetical protein